MEVYISNYLSHSISILDYDTLEIKKELSLEESIFPHHFCVDEEYGKIFIPSLSSGILYAFDIKCDKIVDSVSIGGSLSQIFLYQDELFISNEDANSIYIINKYTLEPVTMISVDDMPHDFSYNEKTNRLYVLCVNSILCIDVESKCVCDKINTDFKAWHLEIDKKKDEIYISTLDGELVVLNEDSLDAVRVFHKLLLPVQIKFNYRNNKVYISDLGYNQVKILDYELGKYVGKIDVEGILQGIEISKDYSRLFVSDTKNNIVKVYDTETNQLIKDVKVGKEPTTIVCL